MRRPWGLRPLALLLLLELLPRPGDGNEGSVAGSCYCGTVISSGSPPTPQLLAHLRKHLKIYHRCNSYIRFQLPVRSVCGGSKDQWVQELMNCFDLRECGRVDSGSAASRQHAPPRSTRLPEPTETAPLDLGSSAQTHLLPVTRSPQAPALLPAGAPSSSENLTHVSETTTSTVGPGLGAGSEAGEKQKRLEDHVGPAPGTSATVPVVSLLIIIFFLTIVLVYVLCQRKRKCREHSPDLQLHYRPVASDSNA